MEQVPGFGLAVRSNPMNTPEIARSTRWISRKADPADSPEALAPPEIEDKEMADKDTVQEKAASKVFVELEVQKVLTAVEAVRTDVAQSEIRLTDKIADVKADLTGEIGNVKEKIGNVEVKLTREMGNLTRWLIGVGLTTIGLLIAMLWRMPG